MPLHTSSVVTVSTKTSCPCAVFYWMYTKQPMHDCLLWSACSLNEMCFFFESGVCVMSVVWLQKWPWNEFGHLVVHEINCRHVLLMLHNLSGILNSYSVAQSFVLSSLHAICLCFVVWPSHVTCAYLFFWEQYIGYVLVRNPINSISGNTLSLPSVL